ncbi:hypothetical protein QKW60_05515 [Defluviimonas aestuarii]|uniref:hypothetical protein n=1 Tax=Albidovulum aestuarii TaxID=1130726 RepID=UPI00249B1256|nr:hypothetical protein [Defluviimonas aestuarii]MDI3335854.1 hypothetical protein [Defluviimonas aestuarii]
MTRLTATIAMLEDIRDTAVAGINALIEDLETGGLPHGEYEGETPAETDPPAPDEPVEEGPKPPAEEPPTEEPEGEAPSEPESPPDEEAPAPDPAPAPPPPAAPKPPVSPSARRAYIEGLYDRSTPNGIMDKSDMLVAGRDPLPQGIDVTPDAVIINGFSGGIMKPLDVGDRKLIVKSRMAGFAGLLIRDRPGRNAGGIIDIYPTGGIDVIEDLEAIGCMGKDAGAPALLWQRGSGTGKDYRCGHLGHMLRPRIEGFSSDHLKVGGSPFGGTVYEDCYHGPRWAAPGDRRHPDTYTVTAAVGGVTIKNTLIDQRACPDPQYRGVINNMVRGVRDNGKDFLVEEVTLDGVVHYRDDYQTFSVQIDDLGLPNFNGPFRFRDVWMQGGDVDGDMYFHPTTNRNFVSEWINVRDTITDAVIRPPSGARVA